jgi:hypothetical protein
MPTYSPTRSKVSKTEESLETIAAKALPATASSTPDHSSAP